MCVSRAGPTEAAAARGGPTERPPLRKGSGAAVLRRRGREPLPHGAEFSRLRWGKGETPQTAPGFIADMIFFPCK